MQVNINPSQAARNVGKFFFERTGQKLRHAEALELVAGMCGFAEYRAMAAQGKAQDAKEDNPVILDRQIHDWLFLEEPENEDCTEERKRPYRLMVENYGSGVHVVITPEGVSENDFPGKNVMTMLVEINGGVPCVHIGNDPNENSVSVFTTSNGMYVREEGGDWQDQAYAPEGTELERIVKNHGKHANGYAVLRDTGKIYGEDEQPGNGSDDVEPDKKKELRVYINGTLKAVVHSDKEAWDVIGRQPFGSHHVVYDAAGNIVDRFVPF